MFPMVIDRNSGHVVFWRCLWSLSASRSANVSRVVLHPPLAALGEDGLEVAFEEGAGVLEVLFGVGFGGGDAVKRFVEDADDPLLFGERGDGIGTTSRNPWLIR